MLRWLFIGTRADSIGQICVDYLMRATMASAVLRSGVGTWDATMQRGLDNRAVAPIGTASGDPTVSFEKKKTSPAPCRYPGRIGAGCLGMLSGTFHACCNLARLA